MRHVKQVMQNQMMPGQQAPRSAPRAILRLGAAALGLLSGAAALAALASAQSTATGGGGATQAGASSAAIHPQAPPAPAAPALRAQVRAYRAAHEKAIVGELAELSALRNVASNRQDIERNAEALAAMLTRRGLRARLLTAGDSPPAVYAELPAPGARHTVILYAHYDGQPAEAADWKSDPWKPVLRTGVLAQGARDVDLATAPVPLPPEWRLYARAVSDDKAPIVAMLAALDALKASGAVPSVNLKFFLEGEEEAGSPHLQAILDQHQALLGADLWVLADGPVHPSRQLQVCFGARGVSGVEVTVYGPLRGLHSGHYGNWAPNPAALLAHLLADLRDGDGTIRIDGFYDDLRPLSNSEKRAAAAMPPVEDALRQELGLAWSEGGGRLQDVVMRPALNVRGLRSGQVGREARNAIPTDASASIDFRLVPDETPARVRQLLEAQLRKNGFYLVDKEPDLETRRRHPRIVRLAWAEGYPGARTSMDLPASRALLRAVEEGLGGPVLEVPMLGGSIPIYMFTETLKTPVIILPTVNHDNNQHAADENLRLQNLWDGIEVFANLFVRLGPDWP